MLIVRGLVGGLFQISVFAAALLIPAGTWSWPRAIQFLVGYGVVLAVSITWLAIVAPSSLEARLQPVFGKAQASGDRLATLILVAAIGGWLVFIPLGYAIFSWGERYAKRVGLLKRSG